MGSTGSNCFKQTHKIFSFHPATANLQGVEVRAPWQDVLYPHPHFNILEMHYFTSISRAMKGRMDDSRLDDGDDEYSITTIKAIKPPSL